MSCHTKNIEIWKYWMEERQQGSLARIHFPLSLGSLWESVDSQNEFLIYRVDIMDNFIWHVVRVRGVSVSYESNYEEMRQSESDSQTITLLLPGAALLDWASGSQLVVSVFQFANSANRKWVTVLQWVFTVDCFGRTVLLTPTERECRCVRLRKESDAVDTARLWAQEYQFLSQYKWHWGLLLCLV